MTSLTDPKDPALIERMGKDPEVGTLIAKLFRKTCDYKYSYNFSWLGIPIIQYPQDMIAVQEIIWATRPDLIVETGVAHGGSVIFYASMLELLGENGRVVGIDVDIRPHNRAVLEKHPLIRRVTLLEGGSTDKAIVQQVFEIAKDKKRILVILDSNHTHEHVFNELEAYSPLVKQGSYLIVMDTVVEDLPKDYFAHRPWDKGNSPKTAVRDFLQKNDRFEINREIDHKLLLSVAPEGYLRCIKD